MVRVSSVELDLRFRSAAERSILRLSTALRASGRIALRVGGVTIVLGFGCCFILPELASLLFLLGASSTIFGATARLAGVILGAPLRWIRSRRLLRSGSQGAVTLRGRVVPLKTLRSPGGIDVVAFRVRFMRGGCGPEIEKAEPFLLDDGGPEPVLVSVENIYLARDLLRTELAPHGLLVEGLNLLPSSSAPIRYEEALLAPGELVEATGWLDERMDPSLSTAFRRAPVRRVLQGRPDAPLVVRAPVDGDGNLPRV